MASWCRLFSFVVCSPMICVTLSCVSFLARDCSSADCCGPNAAKKDSVICATRSPGSLPPCAMCFGGSLPPGCAVRADACSDEDGLLGGTASVAIQASVEVRSVGHGIHKRPRHPAKDRRKFS